MKKLLKPTLFICLLAACIAIYFIYFQDVSAYELRTYIEASGAIAPLIYILAFAILPIVFIPAQLLVPISGLLFGLWGGFAYTMIGAVVNSAIMFLMSRYLLGDNLGDWLKRRCPEKWRDNFFSAKESNSFLLVFILRLIPAVPYNIINFGAGLISITFTKYIIATALGIIPGVLVYVNIGDKATDITSATFIISIALLIALTVLSIMLAKAIKSGKYFRALPILFEQKLMFSPRIVEISSSEAIFWPGCSMISLDKHLVDSLYNSLKNEEPDLGYCSYCCGKPSMHLADKKIFDSRITDLNNKINKAGVKRIYTACPNCKNMLTQYSDFEIISVWPILAKHFPPEKKGILEGKNITLHDPCPLRNDTQTHNAIRDILSQADATINESAHIRNKTICCGNHNMLMQTNPDKGQAMLNKCLDDMPNLLIATYCQSCAEIFNKNDRDSIHVIELLWGKSLGNKFINKLKNCSADRVK